MLTLHIIGITIALMIIIAVSVYSSKLANKNKGANSWVVAGAIMGTLVGGSSTIGTAQLAYQYGMSAWWFTLGSGIACLILALVYAKPFHESGNKTLNAFIAKEYGQKNGVLSSVCSSVGSFINVISQLIASTAIIAVILPDLPLSVLILFSALFMVLYVVFGGVKGSGIVGVFKMVLLYLTMLIAGILVLAKTNGLPEFIELVNKINNPEKINFYSLFARGVSTDLASCFSLILGVVTTQSYAQAIFMADSKKIAIKGSLISAMLIPPVGVCGILVGLYMRAVQPGIVSKTALTCFVTEYMPPLVAGIVLGTLFIAVIGTGAGLALGIAVSLKNDVLPIIPLKAKKITSGNTIEKILIVIVLILASVLSMGTFGDTILNFAFMSMGLRGATVFAPLCGALWFSGRISKKSASFAIIAGPTTVLLVNLLNDFPVEPLFAGVLVTLSIMLMGYFAKLIRDGRSSVS